MFFEYFSGTAISAEKDDLTLTNALKVYHPLNIEIYGFIENNKCVTETVVTNHSDTTLSDINISIKSNDSEQSEMITSLPANQLEKVYHQWQIKEPQRPTNFNITVSCNTSVKKPFGVSTAQPPSRDCGIRCGSPAPDFLTEALPVSSGNMEKHITKHLVFSECKYIENPDDSDAWNDIRAIEMTGRFEEQIDPSYTSRWDGDDDISANIKMAWNEKAVYFKMEIKDDVLVPSKTNLLMFGDSFQIGLNPLYTEAVANQSFYDIMMTRGAEQDYEKAYMERPPQIALEYPIKSRLLLDGLYHGTLKNNVFSSILTLPAQMVSPLHLIPGAMFGLYFIIFDNDGAGLKTSLQWPLASEKYLKQAWYIPYGGAWASIKLTK